LLALFKEKEKKVKKEKNAKGQNSKDKIKESIIAKVVFIRPELNDKEKCFPKN
jgi:hypothetical protein